jgi:hypothetical protein
MRRGVSNAIAAIAAHAVVGAVHGETHVRLGVTLTSAQSTFVNVVILVAPLLAGVLIWRPAPRAGGWLLLTSMFGALIFGLWNHFLVPGSDNVSSMPANAWGASFQVTAVLLAVTES